jgi:hypothetical protein
MTDITKLTKYTLLEPISFEGREISELQFRRMKGKDIRKVEAMSDRIEQTAFLIGELSGNAPAIFDELDAADIDGLSKVIEGFMKRKAR